MRRLIPLMVLAAACGTQKAAPDAAPAAVTAKAPPTSMPTSRPVVARTARTPRSRVAQKDVAALLEAWLAAQNTGNFAAYRAFYAPTFHGVRRSGKKAVALDHKGWLADRERMFKKPMVVKALDVEIALGPRGATARFAQDWASGTYHDVGPKVLSVEADAKGALAIVHEELLSSAFVQPVADGEPPPILLVVDGLAVLDDYPDRALGRGKAELVAGTFPERDPSCDADPPDYEQDHERYWTCRASQSDVASDRYEASQAVKLDALGAPLRAVATGPLALYDASGVRCETAPKAPTLYGRWTTFAGNVADADAVLDEERRLVIDVSSCKGARWGVLASAPAPVIWDVAAAKGPVLTAAKEAMVELAGFGALKDEPPEMERTFAITEIKAPAGKPGHFVLATADGWESCTREGFVAGLWTVGADGALTLLWSDTDGSFDLVAAVDVEGDGKPELVTDDGMLAVDPEAGDATRTRSLAFRNDLQGCACECGE